MTPLQLQTQNVMNAMIEGAVANTINLYERGLIAMTYTASRRADLFDILVNQLKMEGGEAAYWLTWFNIID